MVTLVTGQLSGALDRKSDRYCTKLVSNLNVIPTDAFGSGDKSEKVVYTVLIK